MYIGKLVFGFLIVLMLAVTGAFGYFLWDTSSKLTQKEIVLKKTSEELATTQQQLKTTQQQLSATQQELNNTKNNLEQKTSELIFFKNSLLPSYVPSDMSEKPSGMMVYTDTRLPIQVSVGTSFAITLIYNTTTGYIWEVGFDQSLLTVERRFTALETEATSSGSSAGASENFEFRTLKKGETNILLNLKQPFLPNAPSLVNKTFRVVIR